MKFIVCLTNYLCGRQNPVDTEKMFINRLVRCYFRNRFHIEFAEFVDFDELTHRFKIEKKTTC